MKLVELRWRWSTVAMEDSTVEIVGSASIAIAVQSLGKHTITTTATAVVSYTPPAFMYTPATIQPAWAPVNLFEWVTSPLRRCRELAPYPLKLILNAQRVSAPDQSGACSSVLVPDWSLALPKDVCSHMVSTTRRICSLLGDVLLR
ncbi:hypothetical protein CBL_05640 [Carabus blaptoides fortunei]